MEGKRNIVWLASFPKSGNTWMRMFLHAIKTGCDSLENFNDLEGSNGIASARHIMDEALGCSSCDMPDIKLQRLRSEIYRVYSNDFEGVSILKVHDAAFHRGILTFPKDVTKKVIYIVRNPFDMVASYANHMSCSIAESISSLCDGKGRLASNKYRLDSQVQQYMGSWSDHYHSWKNLYRDNIEIVRYEDMLNNSFATFERVVRSLGWTHDSAAIEKAVRVSDFKNLRALEEEHGFREKAPKTKQFFRQGKTGAWRNEITAEQAAMLVDRHFYTLLELEYIDANGDILV